MYSEQLELAKKAARAAAEIHLKYFTRDAKVKNKGVAHDKVTIADIEAEEQIVALIRSRFPDHNFIGEEAQYSNTSSEFVWLIDPLDGTVNYSKNLPHFSVSIGLFHQGKPAVGVVYDTMRRELFHAAAGMGAFLNDNPIHVSTTESLVDALLYTGFHYDRGRKMKKTLEQIETFFSKGIVGVRRTGSSALDLCYLACGRGDGFWEHTLNSWDRAAAAVIIQEAGGCVTDWSGNDPGTKKIATAASNGRIHDLLLSVLQE